MELSQFILLARRRKKVIFFAILFFLAIGAVLVFRSPLDYRAGARILITENYGANTPLDPYVVAQSNVYLSGLLTQVVGSDAFYEQVIGSGFSFDKTYFSGDLKTQLARWRHAVEAFAAGDSGIIEIRTYHPDKFQAEQLAQAVVFNLKENHAQFHSSGEKVSLKVIDPPLVSDYPVRPDLFLTFGSALLFGFAFGLFYIYLFSYPRELYLPQNQSYFRPNAALSSQKNLQPIEPFEPEPAYQTARQAPNYVAAPPPQNQPEPEYLPQGERVSPGMDQAIGRGDMRNVFGHKGL
jgi:uncharacterized protein involved in exopolysaccharide biosynthesis